MNKSAAKLLNEINNVVPKADENENLDDFTRQYIEQCRIYTTELVTAVIEANEILKDFPDAMDILTEQDMRAFSELLESFDQSSIELLLDALKDEENGNEANFHLKNRASLDTLKVGNEKGKEFLLELLETRKKTSNN